jgi:phosphoglycolate phosphatase-like HAD superfamily hydrolase
MIRNFIWDADGTLFDTYPAITRAMRRAVADFGAEVPAERVSKLVNVSFGHCARTLGAELGVDAGEILNRFREILPTLPLTLQPPFPGVLELCHYALDHGGKNCIVTHRGRASLTRLLVTHGMADLFAEFAAGDDGYPRKPDPAAFNAVLDHQELARAETLAIGDREIDTQGAQAAGLRTCFFGENPYDVTPDVAVQDYAALLAWVLRENGETAPPGAPDGDG